MKGLRCWIIGREGIEETMANSGRSLGRGSECLCLDMMIFWSNGRRWVLKGSEELIQWNEAENYNRGACLCDNATRIFSYRRRHVVLHAMIRVVTIKSYIVNSLSRVTKLLEFSPGCQEDQPHPLFKPRIQMDRYEASDPSVEAPQK